jgi:hypothetical protein
MKCRAGICNKETVRESGLCDDHALMVAIFGESSIERGIGVIDLDLEDVRESSDKHWADGEKTMKATHIKADGTETVIERNYPFTLEELQGFVGGYIQISPIKNELLMVMDEDGHSKNLPINQKASQLHSYGPPQSGYYDRPGIVGDVLVCEKGMIV